MPRQTRSQGAAPDPELGPDEFWLTPQAGAKKDKLKATIVPPSASGPGFITVKVPSHRYRALSILEGVSRPGDPSAAGAFASLQTTPEKKEQKGEKTEDSVDDSAVDLNTPASGSVPAGTAVAQTQVPNQGERESAGIKTPERPSISPITSPEQEARSSLPQNFEEQQSTSVGVISEPVFDQSSKHGPTEAGVRTNEQPKVSELVTSIPGSPSGPSTTLPESVLTSVFEQPHYSLEPSPKTRTRDLEPQPSPTYPHGTTAVGSALTELHTPPFVLNSTQRSTTTILSEDRTGEDHSSVSSEALPAEPNDISVSAPQSLLASVDSSAADNTTEQIPSSPQVQSPAKRHRSVTPASPEEGALVKRRPGRPKKEPQRFTRIVKLPIKKGYVLTEDMAPVRDPQDVSGSMKEVIQNMFDASQTVVGFVPESQELLIDRMAELTQNLAHLQNITNPDTSPNNPVHTIRIAPEIVDYVDDSRNPDIFTRDFAELVQRGNAVMNGKKQAFSNFAEIYARELKKGIGGMDKQVDAIMENAGMPLKEESKPVEQRAQENGEKSS